MPKYQRKKPSKYAWAIELYKERIMNRQEICKMFKFKMTNFMSALVNHKVDVWDTKQQQKKKKEYKNFNWKEFNHGIFRWR